MFVSPNEITLDPDRRVKLVYDKTNGRGSLQIDGVTILTGSATGIAFNGAVPVAQAAEISDPTGGETEDAEARAAIGDIIDALQGVGIVATS